MESQESDELSSSSLLQNQNHDDFESNHHHFLNQGGGTTSFFNTCFNGLNAMSGIGILSIPFAIASGGWLSLFLFFIIAITSFYTSLLIQKCMVVDSTIISYPDIGERAFGKLGRRLLLAVMCVELYLVATGFLILEGDNLNNLFPNMEIKIGNLSIAGKHGFIVIAALIILPSVLLDSLSNLSYVSLSGVMALIIILLSVIWTGAFEGVGFEQKGTALNWHGIPTSVSLYAFCYCTHPVFPTLYNSMRSKHQFTNVLITCFLFCTISYAAMAIFGYMMFGSEVQSQITLNLPITKLSSKVAIYTTLVNPISKYALMVTPIINAAQRWFPCYRKNRVSSLLLRTALVASTVVVALVVPFFAHLMSLVGALLSVTASLILPCLCYLRISGTFRKFSYELVIIGVILLVGVSITITGTYTSIVEIVKLW